MKITIGWKSVNTEILGLPGSSQSCYYFTKIYFIDIDSAITLHIVQEHC